MCVDVRVCEEGRGAAALRVGGLRGPGAGAGVRRGGARGRGRAHADPGAAGRGGSAVRI